MRTAIISDVHGNLPAFTSFLEISEELNVRRILCLGDIVGYNPWPNECIDIIKEMGIPCVMGNHDRVACGEDSPDSFNLAARGAILWTREVLTESNRKYLAALPDMIVVDKEYLLVHGSPRDPNEYIFTHNSAIDNIEFMKSEFEKSLCFFGHTHVVFAVSEDRGKIEVFRGESVQIEKEKGYLINPGSIGQPRDGDPKAAFLIYDEGKQEVKFHRFDYDIDAVYEAVIDAGIDPYLGKRLFLGR